ncbi:MAG TPA: zinc-binding alcohol dehydrogenase family protein [Hyphomicrobiales bacterium]|nr:zinc-binding alcohol dehydrogenase family protein [Hyphomicrobiales bacterium]
MSAARPEAVFEGRALRLSERAASIAAFRPALEPRRFACSRDDEVVVEVHAAGVNQSDAKAALGTMPQAVWPRTPGRDFAGIVVDGPAALMGRAVWGTGGDLGITRDGSHATHLVLPANAVALKPAAVPMREAGGAGVPFVTALLGFERAGMPRPGDFVLVLGVNGKVGQAAAQIATARGAKVIGVGRGGGYAGHASAPVDFVDGSAPERVAQAVRALTAGHGADIVMNAVGSPYFDAAQEALASFGRQIILASLAPVVPLRIFDFYHGSHAYFGVDSLGLDAAASARLLERLAPDFEAGRLVAFPAAGGVHPFAEAAAAYAEALAGGRGRVILIPNG